MGYWKIILKDGDVIDDPRIQHIARDAHDYLCKGELLISKDPDEISTSGVWPFKKEKTIAGAENEFRIAHYLIPMDSMLYAVWTEETDSVMQDII